MKSPDTPDELNEACYTRLRKLGFQNRKFVIVVGAGASMPLIPKVYELQTRINPLFPALRSGPTAVSGASRQKQIPSSNCLGAAAAIQAALPALKAAPSGSIVLFSSVAVAQGMPFHASIAAAKGAVEGLALSLAAELAPKIRVNVIAPSLTDTPLAGTLLNSDAKREAAAKRHPLQQTGDPEDSAKLVAFLLSENSRFMTGQVLRPDGGLSSIRTF